MTLTIDKTLDVELDDEGSIVSAETWAPALCNWIDCTEYVKTSRYWKERIKEELAIKFADANDECAEFKLAADR